MLTLDEIALKYKTDKSSKYHNYTKHYEQYFNCLRDKKIRILEIGVCWGYSIQMWDEYFYNAELIVGLDIDITNSKHLQSDKIKIVQGDQFSIDDLKSINKQYGPFDIIIDDGCHTNLAIMTSFNTLFPLLNNDGYYIVEDLNCCYWNKVNKIRNNSSNFIRHLKGLVDDVNNRGKGYWGDRDKFHLRKTRPEHILLEMEKFVDAVLFYKSICFIKKHEIEEDDR